MEEDKDSSSKPVWKTLFSLIAVEYRKRRKMTVQKTVLSWQRTKMGKWRSKQEQSKSWLKDYLIHWSMVCFFVVFNVNRQSLYSNIVVEPQVNLRKSSASWLDCSQLQAQSQGIAPSFIEIYQHRQILGWTILEWFSRRWLFNAKAYNSYCIHWKCKARANPPKLGY